ncbi:YidH family protein [Altericista sp. CCNU0014]|uniref:YidH family protein n=1 Tax=Altericista sp. CCNU0014 TaxID=3082949 RepID=UPI00384E547C
MSLPNTDPNRQRDHQANERTFLAWLRTALALIAFGFAIARFGLFTRQIHLAMTNRPPIIHPVLNSENLGTGLALSGLLTMMLAVWKFNQAFRQIEQKNYRPSRWPMWFMTGLVMALGIMSLPLVLWREDSPTRTQPNLRRPID